MVAPSVLPGRAFQRIDRVSRAIFHWRAADMDLKALSGQAGTLTRASAGGSVIDRVANLRTPSHSQPRFQLVDLDGDGVLETPALLLEEARTQRFLESETLGTWTLIGTPTRTAAAIRRGDFALDLAGDDDGASAEGWSRAYGSGLFPGDGVKAVSVFMMQGLTSPAGGTQILLYDTTAGNAHRLHATVTWSNGAPSVVMSTGTLLKSEHVGGGLYRLHFQTTAVTAANAHTFEFRPATVAAQTGNVYANGFQLEDAAFPTSYVRSPASQVARIADLFTFPFDALPQTLSIYARLVRPLHADVTGALGANQGIFDLGNAATNHVWAYFDAAARNIVASVESGGAQTISAAVPAGAELEVAVQLSDVGTGPRVRLDVGAGFGNLSTATPAALAAFGAAQLQAGGINPSSAKLNGGLIALKVAAGLRTLAELREML